MSLLSLLLAVLIAASSLAACAPTGDKDVNANTPAPIITKAPTAAPTEIPTGVPSTEPTETPTAAPTQEPTDMPEDAKRAYDYWVRDPLNGMGGALEDTMIGTTEYELVPYTLDISKDPLGEPCEPFSVTLDLPKGWTIEEPTEPMIKEFATTLLLPYDEVIGYCIFDEKGNCMGGFDYNFYVFNDDRSEAENRHNIDYIRVVAFGLGQFFQYDPRRSEPVESSGENVTMFGRLWCDADGYARCADLMDYMYMHGLGGIKGRHFPAILSYEPNAKILIGLNFRNEAFDFDQLKAVAESITIK